MEEQSANIVPSISTSVASSSNSNDTPEEVFHQSEMPRSASEPLDLQKSPNSIAAVADKELQETDGKRAPETGSLRDLLRARNESQANRPAVVVRTESEATSSGANDQPSTSSKTDSKLDASTVSKTASEDATKPADSSVVMRHSRQSGSSLSIFSSDPNRQACFVKL